MANIRTVESSPADIFLIGPSYVEPVRLDGIQIQTVHQAIDVALSKLSEGCGAAYYADRTEGQTGSIIEYTDYTRTAYPGNRYAVYKFENHKCFPCGESHPATLERDMDFLFDILVFDAAQEFDEDFERIAAAARHGLAFVDIAEAVDRAFESAQAYAQFGNYDISQFEIDLESILKETSIRRKSDGQIEARVDVRNISNHLVSLQPGLKILRFEYSTNNGGTWTSTQDYIQINEDSSLMFSNDRDWVPPGACLSAAQIEAVDTALSAALECMKSQYKPLPIR